MALPGLQKSPHTPVQALPPQEPAVPSLLQLPQGPQPTPSEGWGCVPWPVLLRNRALSM